MKKVMAPCVECFKETGIPNFNFVIQEQNDECVYSFKCNKGHEFTLVQQTQRFELKFDMACISYTNDDYSAAVMHCASAIERFEEFFVQSIWLNDNSEDTKLSYEKYWKKVKSRSERQSGTFCAMYFSKFNDLDNILKTNNVNFTDSDTNFRNNVVHKGHYANKEKTFLYLEKSYKYISILLKSLQEKYPNGIIHAISYNMNANINEYKKSYNKEVYPSTMAEYHIISTTDLDNIKNPKPLIDRIKFYNEFTEKMSDFTNFTGSFIENITSKMMNNVNKSSQN